jgi:WhiB family redox-sensing transcriptional regulator
MIEVIVPLAALFISPDDAADLDWQDRALCAQTDPEAFFPDKGGSTREAKRVCRSCEVRAECLEYALEHDERFGIWGGMSERERRRLKRQARLWQAHACRPAPRYGLSPQNRRRAVSCSTR